ncbi:MAG TPA: mycofactocin system GMC family oxidoreductase MftG [Chloroflexota bacterium]|nr:mycofactocin system GMC family oxidoreductase MftG [Chloroflexota bacterium]
MQYDVIVVGAGSAGAIVAARLSEDPRRSVLLLEAGPDYAGIEALPPKIRDGLTTAADITPSDHDWGYVGTASPTAGPLGVFRGKVIGGSSATNGQIFLRGTPDDFAAWEAAGAAGWGFEQVLPYYRKLERDLDFGPSPIHGGDGPIPVRRFRPEEWLPPQVAFVEACRDAGFATAADLNEPGAEGVGAIPLNNHLGVRWSTSLGYLDPSRHRLNLTIRSGCTVHRVLFDGRRATGVAVWSRGELFEVYGGAVVLSAGAVGSPHLLMLSGVGPADQLRAAGVAVRHELPGVGQNLRDHPHVGTLWRHKPGYPMHPDLPRYQVCLRYTAPGSHLRTDAQVLMVSFASGRVDRGGDGRTPLGIAIQPVLNLAVGRGEIRLRSADPSVQPSIDLNMLEEPFDRQRLRDAVRLCLSLGEHAAFRDLVDRRIGPPSDVVEDDAALDAWMRRNVSHTNHLSCTCKMGPASDRMAVVDPEGRVHGVENLWVADASIWPDCVRANTNATAMMTGERMADLLRGR